MDYQRCVPRSTCFSCCRCSMSARGSIEGLPWAHWKGSLQDDKASISLQLSSKVKCSLNLIAPEKERQILAPAAKEDSTSFYSCGFQWKKSISKRLAERLQRQPKSCSMADLGLSSIKVIAEIGNSSLIINSVYFLPRSIKPRQQLIAVSYALVVLCGCHRQISLLRPSVSPATKSFITSEH